MRTACPPGSSGGVVSNFEIKSFDGCANPHFGLASIVAAGIDGLRRKLSLPEPIGTSIFALLFIFTYCLNFYSVHCTIRKVSPECLSQAKKYSLNITIELLLNIQIRESYISETCITSKLGTMMCIDQLVQLAFVQLFACLGDVNLFPPIKGHSRKNKQDE